MTDICPCPHMVKLLAQIWHLKPQSTERMWQLAWLILAQGALPYLSWHSWGPRPCRSWWQGRWGWRSWCLWSPLSWGAAWRCRHRAGARRQPPAHTAGTDGEKEKCIVGDRQRQRQRERKYIKKKGRKKDKGNKPVRQEDCSTHTHKWSL